MKNEMEVWRQLNHKHIAPLWGICYGFGDFASFVCPWFDNGSLNQYLNTRADLEASRRLSIVRISSITSMR